MILSMGYRLNGVRVSPCLAEIDMVLVHGVVWPRRFEPRLFRVLCLGSGGVGG